MRLSLLDCEKCAVIKKNLAKLLYSETGWRLTSTNLVDLSNRPGWAIRSLTRAISQCQRLPIWRAEGQIARLELRTRLPSRDATNFSSYRLFLNHAPARGFISGTGREGSAVCGVTIRFRSLSWISPARFWKVFPLPRYERPRHKEFRHPAPYPAPGDPTGMDGCLDLSES